MKVVPIKHLTIPCLELCGAHLLAQLLDHIKEVFHLSLQDISAWTDSTIVLNWLSGNPRCFKTFVGNRVSSFVEHIPPDRWNHVNGGENPANCASRGLFPSELLEYELWWKGPTTAVRLAQTIESPSVWAIWWRKGHLPIEYYNRLSFHWIAIQILPDSNVLLHGCFNSSAIVIQESKPMQSRNLHVSQSKRSLKPKTIGFPSHRKTILKKKF